MSESQGYKNLHGIFFMLINAFVLSMLYVFVQYLKVDLHSNQIVFLYKLAVLIGITPWVIYGGKACFKTNRFKLHLTRGFLSTMAALLFFHGLTKVDMANAIALNKMEPIILMIISAVYFKEKLSTVKVSAAIFSCIGMFFVTYPIVKYDVNGVYLPWLSGNGEVPKFDYNYLFVLGGACLWALNSVVIKALGRTESNRTQMFYISLISVLVSLPTAMLKWDYGYDLLGLKLPYITEVHSLVSLGLTTKHIELITLAALMHFLHVACNFMAFKVGEMSVVVPFDYCRLLFGGLLGWYFFDSIPGLSSCIGYALILVSGVCLLRSEAKIYSQKLIK